MAQPENDAGADGWGGGALLAVLALLCCAAPLLLVLLGGALTGVVVTTLDARRARHRHRSGDARGGGIRLVSATPGSRSEAVVICERSRVSHVSHVSRVSLGTPCV